MVQAQQTNAELKEKLRDIQIQRKNARKQRMAVTMAEEQLKLRIELARSQQQGLVDRLRSTDIRIATTKINLERAQSWNVLASDAYHIDQEIAADGTTIGTINGLRLAAPIYATSWKEINSAFGYVALLLSQLERQVDHCGRTLRYAVQAAGGNSKIGMRNSSTASNLFFAEESFQFFSKRNFNTALGYLLGHVQDLTCSVLQLDRTIVSPYAMDEHARTVAGVSIVWVDDTTSSKDFTRGLWYLLTNLKHLMGYPAIGIWRKADQS
jgi:Apg6 BARA domain